MGGEKKMFYRMLKNIQKMSITTEMNAIAKAIDNKNNEKIKASAHSLKGGVGYIGAGPLFDCCYRI